VRFLQASFFQMRYTQTHIFEKSIQAHSYRPAQEVDKPCRVRLESYNGSIKVLSFIFTFMIF